MWKAKELSRHTRWTVIKQNQCFKGVTKELKLNETFTEAKGNYEKSKGLCTCLSKGRKISPIIGVKWTTGDVRNLEVYFGETTQLLRYVKK